MTRVVVPRLLIVTIVLYQADYSSTPFKFMQQIKSRLRAYEYEYIIFVLLETRTIVLHEYIYVHIYGTPMSLNSSMWEQCCRSVEVI